MKRLLITLIFLPSLGWATYIPVNGSTVNVQSLNNNTTSLPVYVTNPTTTTIQSNASVNLNQVSGSAVTTSGNSGEQRISAEISGSSNTVQITGTPTVNAAQSGTWNVNATPVGTSTVTFNGIAQPVSLTGTNSVYLTNPATATITNSTVAVSNVSGQNLNINIAAGSIANTGFNVNNAPTVVTSTSGVNGSTMAVVNAVGTTLAISGSISVSNPSTGTINSAVPGAATFVGGQGVAGNLAGFRVDSSSNLYVNVAAGSGGTSSNFTTAFPSAGTAAGFTNGTNMQAARVNTSSDVYVYTDNIATVTFNSVGQPVLLSTSGVNGSTTAIVNAVGTTLSVSGTVTSNQGTNPWIIGASTIGVVSATPLTITQSTFGVVQVGPGNWTIGNSTVAVVTPSGQPLGVSQSGTRWTIAFSTTSTTAVLSSTAVTTSIAISTPVAGVASQTVRIFSLILNVDSPTNINFRDGSTNFGDTYYLSTGGSLILDPTDEPWYITSSGNGFVIKQSGTANVSIKIRYTQS